MNRGAAFVTAPLFNPILMKRTLSALFISLFGAFSLLAQQPVFLFPEFQPGTLSFQGFERKEEVLLNIDAMGQRVFYLQGETLMELTNMYLIDTLLVSGKRFVMKEGLLCEQLAWPGDTVYVNWKFKNVNKGSKGALGATTQNKVDVLWTSLTPGEPVKGDGMFAQRGDYVQEVWQRKGNNTYIFKIGGVQYKAQRLKDLYKAFPDQAPALKAYVKEKKYTLENAQQALQVISYLKQLF